MKTILLRFSAGVLLGAATSFVALSGPGAGCDYQAHEWGTFTSIQGADGVPIAWNPFVRNDLPAFVYKRQRPMPQAILERNPEGFAFLCGKDGQSWLQRMETPVIYFHTDHPLNVEARVGFPKGLITEWYPRAASFGPVFGLDKVLPETRESFLKWQSIQVSPSGSIPSSVLPRESGGSHYYAARDVQSGDVTIAGSEGIPSETDRFLFYRGAGNFPTPLKVSMPSPRELLIENQGTEALTGLHVIEARQDRGYEKRLAQLRPGESLRLSLPEPAELNSRTEVTETLARGLQRDLTEAGLYADEAAAMIATWRDAWLGEDGLRVLYLLPRKWTDKTLPLTLEPAPSKLVRVMVGRAEVFAPSEEKMARAAFAQFRSARDPLALRKAFASVNPRFQEPLLARIGAIETAWITTSSLWSCVMPPPIEQQTKVLQEDIRGAHAVLQAGTQYTSGLAPNDPPVDSVAFAQPPIPSDNRRRSVQSLTALNQTP